MRASQDNNLLIGAIIKYIQLPVLPSVPKSEQNNGNEQSNEKGFYLYAWFVKSVLFSVRAREGLSRS